MLHGIKQHRGETYLSCINCMENSNYTDNDVIDISISFDGTWRRHGYSSHYGVGVAIETRTGLVIDVHAVSNYCVVCVKGPAEDSPNFEQWKAANEHRCQKNWNCPGYGGRSS